MNYYGKSYTWKIVYTPKVMDGGIRGVALIEAETRADAMHSFSHQYAGEYFTVESCTKLNG